MTSIKSPGSLLTTPQKIIQTTSASASQKFRHSLLDDRVRRGADAESEHHLPTAKIQLKLKGMKHKEEGVKFNTRQFGDIGTSIHMYIHT